MDKHTIIRLLEAGRSQRSVSRELGLNRKTIGRYWKEHLIALEELKQDPTDPTKKEAITACPKYKTQNRQPRKYTAEIDQRVDEIGSYVKFSDTKMRTTF